MQLDTKSIAIIALKASFYQEKLREKGVINLNEPQNNLHSNKIQTSLMLAKFEKIGRVGGEYAKDKEWFVKKNVLSFLDICVPIHC